MQVRPPQIVMAERNILGPFALLVKALLAAVMQHSSLMSKVSHDPKNGSTL
jgi:hypothetical protein